MANQNNQTPISQLPKDQQVQVWNMTTNTVSIADKALFDRIEASKSKIVAAGQNQYSEFEQDNYRLDQFSTGDKRKIFHNDTGWVGIMTNDLFDEIKKRNPVSATIKTKEGEPYERWKKFLSTESQVKKTVGDKWQGDEPKEDEETKPVETPAIVEKTDNPKARKTGK